MKKGIFLVVFLGFLLGVGFSSALSEWWVETSNWYKGAGSWGSTGEIVSTAAWIDVPRDEDVDRVRSQAEVYYTPQYPSSPSETYNTVSWWIRFFDAHQVLTNNGFESGTTSWSFTKNNAYHGVETGDMAPEGYKMLRLWTVSPTGWNYYVKAAQTFPSCYVMGVSMFVYFVKGYAPNLKVVTPTREIVVKDYIQTSYGSVDYYRWYRIFIPVWETTDNIGIMLRNENEPTEVYIDDVRVYCEKGPYYELNGSVSKEYWYDHFTAGPSDTEVTDIVNNLRASGYEDIVIYSIFYSDPIPEQQTKVDVYNYVGTFMRDYPIPSSLNPTKPGTYVVNPDTVEFEFYITNNNYTFCDFAWLDLYNKDTSTYEFQLKPMQGVTSYHPAFANLYYPPYYVSVNWTYGYGNFRAEYHCRDAKNQELSTYVDFEVVSEIPTYSFYVSPITDEFTCTAGETCSRTYTIFNDGEVDLTITVTGSDTWIMPEVSSVFVPAGESRNVVVDFDTSPFSAGDVATGSVDFYEEHVGTKSVSVTMHVEAPPPVPPGISSCGVDINTPGDYHLSTDLSASSGDYCIRISSSDVNLDLMGHTITSYGVPIGIMVEGGISNVKIYNGEITNFEYGIAIHNTTDYEIYSLDLSGNIWGLYTHLADEGTISQIYFEGTGGAIKIEACSDMLFNNLELKSTGSKPAIYAFGLTNSTLIDVKVGYIERTTAEGETISGWDFKEGTYQVQDVSACPDKAIDCRSCINNRIVRGYFCGRLVFDEYSRENIIAKPTFDFVGKELMAIEFLKGDLDYNNTICGGQYAMEGEMVCNAQTEVCTYDLGFISVVDYIYDHNQGLTGNIYKDKCYGIYIPGACKDEVGYVCLNTTTRAYVTQDCTYINVRNCEAYQICQNGVCVNTTGLQGTGLLIGDLLSSTTNVVGLSLGIDTTLAKYVTWFIIGMAVGIAIGYYVSPAWGIIAFSSLLGIGAMIGWFPVWYAVIMIVLTVLLFASSLGRAILGVGGG